MRFISVILLITLSSTKVYSMDFHLFYHNGYKINTVVAEGIIQKGDDKKFETISKKAGRDRFGNIILVLNSPGGDVNAALAMANSMDKILVTTIVAGPAICASACASVIYVSGKLRAVLDKGTLGFHSCYTVNTDGFIVKSHNGECNDMVGMNALSHGIDYATVDVWTGKFGPDKMAYIGADVACQIGLCSKELVPNSKTSEEYQRELFNEFNNKK